MNRRVVVVLGLLIAGRLPATESQHPVAGMAVSGPAALASAQPSGSTDVKRAATPAGVITLKRWTIDSGGGVVGAGGIQLHATVGQPDPGFATGGGYRLQAGFWYASNSGRLFADGFE